MTNGDHQDGIAAELAILRRRVQQLEQTLEDRAHTAPGFVSSAIEQAAHAILITNRQGRIEYVNSAFTALSGYTLDELRGRNPRVLKSGEMSPAVYADLWRTILAGAIWRGEMHNRAKSGALFWMSVTITPVRDEHGTITHFMAVNEDITARRQAERALRENQTVLRALMDAPGDVTLIVDPDGVLLDCNAAAAQQLGAVREELIGRPVWDGMPPVVRARRMQHLRDVVASARPLRYEDPSGDVWYETVAYPVLDDAGQVVRVVVVARDITERKRNEHRLRASEERTRTMLDAVPDLIFRMSGDGDYLDIRESDVVPLVAPREQLLGRNVRDVLPPEAVEGVLERLQSALRTGKPQTREYTLPVDGKEHAFEVRSVPIGPDEVFSIVRDITEQRQVRQRMLELALERERVQMLTSFITDASHEFRTPLSIIGLKAYLLSTNRDPDRREGYLNDITAQITQLATLIDSLLVMTRLDSRTPLAIDRVNVKLLMSEVLSTVRDDAGACGITLAAEFADNLPALQGDAEFLQQAFEHVVHNALRYTPVGGTIAVAVALDPADDGHIIVAVRDDGVGIAPDELPRIFDRFYRGDKAHSTRGFGLGLSIVKAIVERHNGRIEVDSTVRQGSTFRLVLPVGGPDGV